jgi:hypothetical protein
VDQPNHPNNSEHLKRQLDRSRKTYLAMRDAGYDKKERVRLRFAYKPTQMEDAFALAGDIREKTKYFVEAREVDDGWMVQGDTGPVKLSAATLGRWVYWMCTTGYRQDCIFDGWGARLGGNDNGNDKG